MIQKNFYGWLIPIAFFQLYLAAVALLFFFGPWPWIVDDANGLAAYLTAASIAIGVEYALSWPQVRDTPDLDWDERARTGLTWLRWATIISLMMTIPTSLARTGQIFPDVLSGFADTEEVYNSQLARLSGGTSYVVFEYIRFILSPLLIALLPLTVVYWKRAGIFLRCGAVFLYCSTWGFMSQEAKIKVLPTLLPSCHSSSYRDPSPPRGS